MTRLTVPVLVPNDKSLSKADSDGGTSGAAQKLAPQVSTPKPLNIKMTGLKAPGLNKQPGETGEQAVTRHLDEHEAHLGHLESHYGFHTPRGHATVMMGLPGSGKSHYLKDHHLAGGTHVHMDVDALKALAPGEKDWKYPSHYPEGHAQAGVPHPQAGQQIKDAKYDDSDKVHVASAHPVSKRLEQGMFEQAKARRLPVALDTTGGNHKKWGERMGALKDAGYHQVNLVHVRVSKATSMARNAGRSRQVPQSVIDETLHEHEPTHPNNDGKTPFHILSKHADNVHLIDHEPAGAPHPQGKAGMGSRPDRAHAGWKSFAASEAAMKGGTVAKGVNDHAEHMTKTTPPRSYHEVSANFHHDMFQHGGPEKVFHGHMASGHACLHQAAALHQQGYSRAAEGQRGFAGGYLREAQNVHDGLHSQGEGYSQAASHRKESLHKLGDNIANMGFNHPMSKADTAEGAPVTDFTHMIIGLHRSR